eukprot:scaffold121474_cov29-Tisochrysis_lutea.AAC.4
MAHGIRHVRTARMLMLTRSTKFTPLVHIGECRAPANSPQILVGWKGNLLVGRSSRGVCGIASTFSISPRQKKIFTKFPLLARA